MIVGWAGRAVTGLAIRASIGQALRQFDQIERPARVAVGGQGQAPCLRLAQGQPQGVGAAAQDGLQLGLAERPQAIHPGPRQQRRVQFEGGVFGGGANQGQRAVFDKGQKGILLRLVEAVHLVDKQHALAARGALGPPGRNGLANGLDAIHHRGQRQHAAVCRGAQQARQGGLADSGRSPQDHGMQRLRVETAAQGFARRQKMALADKILGPRGAQLGGQGLRRRGCSEQFVVHGPRMAAPFGSHLSYECSTGIAGCCDCAQHGGLIRHHPDKKTHPE